MHAITRHSRPVRPKPKPNFSPSVSPFVAAAAAGAFGIVVFEGIGVETGDAVGGKELEIVADGVRDADTDAVVEGTLVGV